MHALRFLLCWALVLWLPQAVAQVATLARAQVAPAGAAAMDVSLPHEWEASFPHHTGIAEYRLRFAAPAGEDLLAVYVQRACTNLEVRVNGELIGSGGRMEPPFTRNCYYPHLFALPRSLLRAGDNDLVVRVAGHAAREVSARQRAAGLSAVQVGPLATLQQAHERQYFWNITVAQIIATLLLGLGTGMLGLWAARRREGYLLFFGLFTVGWGLLSTRLFVRDLPLSSHAVEVLICAAFFPVVGCAFVFLLRLLERRLRRVELAIAVQALLAPMVLVLTPPTSLLDVATVLYNLLMLEFLLAALFFFAVAWRSHRRDFWVLGSVLLIVLLLSAAEIALQNNLLPLPKVHLIHFAMPLMFVVIGARLIQLFVHALRHAEVLNQQLEQRVVEKSREIEHNWQQIAQLRTVQAAQDERRRIASDLHDDLGAQLLTIVQASQRGGEPDRIAGMARQALDEMRLSVRGLTGSAAAADDALADWRSETVTRLADAGITAQWMAQEPPAGLVLPARAHVQLTRILREAVSNAIRHSGCRTCRIELSFPAGELQLLVEDDGCGLHLAPGRTGHGLPNIERRARNLGGSHRFESPEPGGTRLVVRVPLPASPHAQEAA